MSHAEVVAVPAELTGYDGLLALDQAVLDAFPSAVYVCAADGVLMRFNRRATELWGRTPRPGDTDERFCGAFLLYHLDGTHLPHCNTPMAVALATGEPQRNREVAIERPDGSRVVALVNIEPLTDSFGRVQGAINCFEDITARRRGEAMLRSQTERLEALNRIARTLSGDLTLDSIVQAVTDSATELSGARFGAFFYNQIDEGSGHYPLYALSGAPRAAFDKFELPRNTAVFAPTFRGERIVRSDDIRKDPRYGKNAPYFGMPQGHLPVVSYLAVPVKSRDGAVHGALLFGHDRPGVFTQESEDIVVAIAAHAATAIDNARLLEAAQAEIEQRRRAEESLALRMDERATLYHYTDRLHRADSLSEVFDAALDAILRALRCARASILLFDERQVMAFVAWRGLSDDYRRAVEGHSPWTADTVDPVPICIDDIETADVPSELRATVKREGIGALAFIPLATGGRLVGKFMAYYDRAHAFSPAEVDLAMTIAHQLGFSVERVRAETARRRAEEDLRAREAELGIVIDRTPFMLCRCSRDMRYRFISSAYATFVRRRPEEVINRHVAEILGDEGFKKVLPHIEMVLRGEQAEYEAEIDFSGVGRRVIHGVYTPDKDEHGRVDGWVASLLDITERRYAEDARRRAEDELRKNEERERARAAELQAIMESVPAIIWIAHDRECESIGGNRMSFEFLRLTPHQNPSMSAPADQRPTNFEVRVNGRVLEPEELPVQRAARGEDVQNFEEEVRFDDGTARFLLGNATPLRDAKGQPCGAVAAFVDITERKQAEQDRDLLIAELNHRVKNTLATVISIARQSLSKGADGKDAHRSFEARIRALAQTHGRLAEANWSGVSLETMLTDEFSPYRHDDGDNFELSGPAVMLNPRCALTLGMAIHELTTNATKYGALSAKSGMVSVAWRIAPEDRRLRINWSETGGPSVVPPTHSGFGRLLLERALASDLKGEVQLDFASGGLKCNIAIPLEDNVARIS